MATLPCVVCETELVLHDAHYANAWERSCKKFPCCSAECAMKFDADVHWVPAVLPQVAMGDEARALREMARQRLRGLDEARPVVREMLLAGLSAETLRWCVAESRGTTRSARSHAIRQSALGFFVGLFRGRTTLTESRDQRSAASYADAEADIARWDEVVRRTGESAPLGSKP